MRHGELVETPVTGPRDRANGEEARAAVTRRGCRRGKHSEGSCVTRKARRREAFPPLDRPSPASWWKASRLLTRTRPDLGAPSPRPAVDSSSVVQRGGMVERTARTDRPTGWVATPSPEGGGEDRRAVEAPWRGCGHSAARQRTSQSEPETWRTPWSAAGCNRPARHCAEKTVEAGRNGKGGTSSGPGGPEPKADVPRLRGTEARSGRAELMSTEGRSLDNPKRGVRPDTAPANGPPRGGVMLESRGRADSSDPSSPKERTRPEDRAEGRLSFPRRAGSRWNPEGPAVRREGHGGRAGKASYQHFDPA